MDRCGYSQRKCFVYFILYSVSFVINHFLWKTFILNVHQLNVPGARQKNGPDSIYLAHRRRSFPILWLTSFFHVRHPHPIPTSQISLTNKWIFSHQLTTLSVQTSP